MHRPKCGQRKPFQPYFKIGVLFALLLLPEVANAANACSDAIPDRVVFKADQYPGISVQSPEDLGIIGAPNFRKIGNDNAYGTAQPTEAALSTLLSLISRTSKNVLWLNMRQEPFLYINGRSFTLRDPLHPFANLLIPGATEESTQQLEKCLETEVKQSASVNNGLVHLYDEDGKGNLVDRPEKLTEVATVAEVFDQLQQEKGFNVNFIRIPVADEQAPLPKNVDTILSVMGKMDPGTALVANCHAGRGRTTTALAIYEIAKNGLDANLAIEKVSAVVNLKNEISTTKSLDKKKNFETRYEVLKSIHQYFVNDSFEKNTNFSERSF